MNNLWHKAQVYFGFADELDGQEQEEAEEENGLYDLAPTVRKISRNDAARAVHKGRARAQIRSVGSTASQGRVHVVEPRNFNDAQRIGDKFKISTPVIINLQGVDANLSKRIIDFVSGLTYALEGGIKKVADKVFLLTPKNTEVSDEEKRRLQERGFFNQF